MSIKQKEIKQTPLTNNCPECFSNDGLMLTFHQKHIENAWYKKATDTISDTIVCHKCHTTIYPVRWTEDIERVREFYLKSVGKPKTFFKLTRLSVFVLIGVASVSIALVVFLQQM
ncbi:hypothetical protein [Galbibacter mesophilus]|uniref:hypothetical protein n=1 Tax=Galbibacter mesophilus TaxID=379069 RepID=UPI00191D9C5A|nr:hypothetical protein [Galbibacter mesophilus]MCM5662483.1 hypothetical protein [Galbibacter mesophilus]